MMGTNIIKSPVIASATRDRAHHKPLRKKLALHLDASRWKSNRYEPEMHLKLPMYRRDPSRLIVRTEPKSKRIEDSESQSRSKYSYISVVLRWFQFRCMGSAYQISKQGHLFTHTHTTANRFLFISPSFTTNILSVWRHDIRLLESANIHWMIA